MELKSHQISPKSTFFVKIWPKNLLYVSLPINKGIYTTDKALPHGIFFYLEKYGAIEDERFWPVVTAPLALNETL